MSPVSEISRYLYLDVFIWESRLARFPRSRFFPTGISVSGLGILPYDSTGLLAGWKQDEFWPRWSRLACIACCIFPIMSIPVNCSDSALRVAKAMIGAKFIIFVFRMSAFFVPWCQNSSPGSLAFSSFSSPEPLGLICNRPRDQETTGSGDENAFSSSRKPGWNFSYEPKAKLVSVTRLIWRGRKSRGTSETGLRLQAYVSANQPRDLK